MTAIMPCTYYYYLPEELYISRIPVFILALVIIWSSHAIDWTDTWVSSIRGWHTITLSSELTRWSDGGAQPPTHPITTGYPVAISTSLSINTNEYNYACSYFIGLYTWWYGAYGKYVHFVKTNLLTNCVYFRNQLCIEVMDDHCPRATFIIFHNGSKDGVQILNHWVLSNIEVE